MLTDRAEGLFRISSGIKQACAAGLSALLAVAAASGSTGNLASVQLSLLTSLAVILVLRSFGPSWREWSRQYLLRRGRTSSRLAMRETVLCALVVFALPFSSFAFERSTLLLCSFPVAVFVSLRLLNRHLPTLVSRLTCGRAKRIQAVVVAEPDQLQSLQEWQDTATVLGLNIVARVDPCKAPGHLARLAAAGDIHQVILVASATASGETSLREDLERVCDEFGLRLAIWMQSLSSSHRPFPATPVDREFTLLAAREPLQNPLNRAFKRSLDILLSLPVVLLVVPPLCVAVKLAQWLQSAGPLFYLQERCGSAGDRFTIFKFRTMHVPESGATDLEDNPEQRIFSAGVFLRASRIDELPQFINVLAGNMSIVGPRPHHAQDRVRFSEVVAHYSLRSIVKPGITGLAQYAEYRGALRRECVRSRVQRDLSYINNWSLALDVLVILKTSRVILETVGRGFLPASHPLTDTSASPTNDKPVLQVFAPIATGTAASVTHAADEPRISRAA